MLNQQSVKTQSLAEIVTVGCGHPLSRCLGISRGWLVGWLGAGVMALGSVPAAKAAAPKAGTGAERWLKRAEQLWAARDFAAIETEGREWLNRLTKQGQADQLGYARVCDWVASSLDRRGAVEFGAGFHREALAAMRRSGQTDSALMGDMLQFAGEAAFKTCRDTEALSLFSESVRLRDHKDTLPSKALANAIWHLAMTHVRLDQQAEAALHFERVAPAIIKHWGISSRDFLGFALAAAECQLRVGKPAKALALLDQVRMKGLDPETQEIVRVIRGHALANCGDIAAAITELTDLEATCRTRMVPDDPRLVRLSADLTNLRATGKVAKPAMAWVRKIANGGVFIDGGQAGGLTVTATGSSVVVKAAGKIVAQADWDTFPVVVPAASLAGFDATTQVRLSAAGIDPNQELTWMACDAAQVPYVKLIADTTQRAMAGKCHLDGSRLTDMMTGDGNPLLTWQVRVIFPGGEVNMLENYRYQAVDTVRWWRLLAAPPVPVIAAAREPEPDTVLP